MQPTEPFVDIHCHLLPGVDDGAQDLEESLAMAKMAVSDGFETIVATPHQLGNNGHNQGDDIRAGVARLQQCFDAEQIGLKVLPGADVRIEEDMVEGLCNGQVLSRGDHRRHVLLELPHEIYLPLDGLLEQLASQGMVGILSHPERNQGILRQPEVVGPLVDAGCLMQVTAGSLTGFFGSRIRKFTDKLLSQGLIHFIATDAHDLIRRQPLMRGAFEHVAGVIDEETALVLCCRNPAKVAGGEDVLAGRRKVKRRGLAAWFSMSLTS